MTAARRRRLQLVSILEGFHEIPVRSGNKTDNLVEWFLRSLGIDVNGMLCGNKKIDADNYRGLDSERDTEEEVEAIVQFFPRPSFLPKTIDGVFESDGVTWGCHMKAVSFIPLLVRLAIELDLFDENDRGGLYYLDNDNENVLRYLMGSDETKIINRDHGEAVDDKYLQFLIQLRDMDLLKKEAIRMYNLLNRLCGEYQYSAEK
jgi:hypothetical protein